MNAKPTFSVIIPVYNAEKTLADAVRSVTGQSFADFELLLVDDCSPDGSAALAQTFCEEDGRIRLLHMEQNGGAARARNAGIAAAAGRYVMFLDSDDVYADGLLERAAAALEGEPDVVLWGLTEEYYAENGALSRTVEILPETDGGPQKTLPDADAVHGAALSLELAGLYGYLWNKAYRAELLAGREIPVQAFNEDEMFNIGLFYDVNSMELLAFSGTKYRIRGTGSLTHRELPDYYPIAMRRIAGIYRQQERWGVFDEAARKKLAGQYVRYIASALERNTHRAANLSHADRLRFLDRVFASDLYRELIPYAAPESRALAVLAKALKKKNKTACLAAGRGIAAVKNRMTGLFYRAKNG